jgi:hypothetical protein
MPSGFAIGHPGQRRVPLLVYNIFYIFITVTQPGEYLIPAFFALIPVLSLSNQTRPKNSGFRRSLSEIFALLRFHAALIGSLLQTFQANSLV